MLTPTCRRAFLLKGCGVHHAEGFGVLAERTVLLCEATIKVETCQLVTTANGLLKPVSQP